MNDWLDARRLAVPIVSAIAALGGALWAGSEMRALRSAADDAAGDAAQILAELGKRPTTEGVKVEILQAVHPLTESMAEVKAELRALAARVEQLESGSK